MAALTVLDASGGIAMANLDTPAGGGDTVAAGISAGGWRLPVILVVRNADATPTDVTVGGVVKSVGATTGLLVTDVVGSPYGAPVAVTYSKVTSLTVGAFRLTNPLT
ncbi:MAG TPA: hypothetical protein VK942_01820 [Actinomycetes bacterium]|nr:hypothetical protein [Actinomycetes bacterium]